MEEKLVKEESQRKKKKQNERKYEEDQKEGNKRKGRIKKGRENKWTAWLLKQVLPKARSRFSNRGKTGISNVHGGRLSSFVSLILKLSFCSTGQTILNFEQRKFEKSNEEKILDFIDSFLRFINHLQLI